jgi:hypothetical protein
VGQTPSGTVWDTGILTSTTEYYAETENTTGAISATRTLIRAIKTDVCFGSSSCGDRAFVNTTTMYSNQWYTLATLSISADCTKKNLFLVPLSEININWQLWYYDCPGYVWTKLDEGSHFNQGHWFIGTMQPGVCHRTYRLLVQPDGVTAPVNAVQLQNY